VCAVALAAAPLAASAGGGVREIRQDCAVGAGCFDGDAPGLPVEITAPGSYRLTGDLVLPDADTGGILLETGDVTIDLNGFTVRGPGGCSGAPLACTAVGLGFGILGERRERVTVRNGAVVGSGSYGIALGRGGLVADVVLAHHGAGPLVARPASVVTRTTALRSAGALLANSHAVVSDTTARGLGASGISAGFGAALSRTTAVGNGEQGILLPAGASATKSVAVANGAEGFQLGTAVLSRSGAHGNGGDGARIAFTPGSAISRFTARGNREHGLDFVISIDSGYRACVVSTNGAGTVTGGGDDLGGSLCNGSTTCP
jgi:hypothetical protein